MITLPVNQGITLEWRTYAPPEVSGGDYTLEDATTITLAVQRPDGTSYELDLGDLARPLDEDDDPVTGTYQATVRGDQAGEWTFRWTWFLVGGEPGSSDDIHVRFRASGMT